MLTADFVRIDSLDAPENPSYLVLLDGKTDITFLSN